MGHREMDIWAMRVAKQRQDLGDPYLSPERQRPGDGRSRALHRGRCAKGVSGRELPAIHIHLLVVAFSSHGAYLLSSDCRL